jgi:hypothetical protein
MIRQAPLPLLPGVFTVCSLYYPRGGEADTARDHNSAENPTGQCKKAPVQAQCRSAHNLKRKTYLGGSKHGNQDGKCRGNV